MSNICYINSRFSVKLELRLFLLLDCRQSALPFRRQLWHLWRYKLLIRALLGPRRAERLVNRAALVISAGTNDLLLNYIASNQSAAGSIGMLHYENYLIGRLTNYTQVCRNAQCHSEIKLVS